MEHHLKCWPGPFTDIRTGIKTFEYRLNDRDYKVGDVLILKEWTPCAYTGESEKVIVSHAIEGPLFGIPEGYIVMSIKKRDNSKF
jgi:hypothetical protein